MNTLTKTLVGTVASGALVVGSAAPAFARDRYHGNGISTGEVIAGALIIGGIAAVAAAASDNDRDYRYRDGYGYRGDGYRGDRYRDYNRRGYGYNDNPRSAVEQCVYATERSANRWSYGGRAKVTDIRDVDRKSDGYNVEGRIAVNRMNRSWRNGDYRYGRGWNNDYRGWNDRYRGYDSGKFKCKIRYGRVVDVDIDGIRGL